MGLTRQQVEDCFRSPDLIGLGMEADAIRRRLHPGGVVTYRVVQTSVLAETSSIDSENLRIASVQRADYGRVAGTCAKLRDRDASVWIEAELTPEACADPLMPNLLREWREAGLDSISVDMVRSEPISAELNASSAALHRMAHASGIHTTLAVPFAADDSIDDRISLLEAARRIQDETGGFRAAVPVALAPSGGRELDGVTAVERLRMLAVCRMVLDNVEHVQIGPTASGLKVLQVGLRFGADDAELTRCSGGASGQELRRVIRDAGFRPVERNGSYSTMFLN